jgi:hypothetical protein
MWYISNAVHDILYGINFNKVEKTQYHDNDSIYQLWEMLFSESDILVYTSIYIVYVLFKFITTTQVHLESFSLRLVPPKSLNSTRMTFMPVSLHPFFSCLNWQTTKSWLSTSKLPQPRVNLIDIAATPALHRCCVSAAHACWTGEGSSESHFQPETMA